MFSKILNEKMPNTVEIKSDSPAPHKRQEHKGKLANK